MRLSGVEKAAFFDPNGSVNDTVRFTRAHEDTTMNVREMLGAEAADTRGHDYFVGYESVMEWMEPDLSDVQQMEQWMTDGTPIQMVAIGPDTIVQWYEPTQVRTSQTTNTSVGDVDPLHARMQIGGGDGTDGDGTVMGYPNGSHRVYVSRNALYPLAYDAEYSIIDRDNDGTPDGYTRTFPNPPTSEDVVNGVYEAFGDTSQDVGRGVVIPMPIEGVTWTLSVEINQLHDDGFHGIRIATSDGFGELDSSFQIASSTGRVTASAEALPGTYQLNVDIFSINGVSTLNQKAKITKPALRVDGGTSYLTR